MRPKCFDLQPQGSNNGCLGATVSKLWVFDDFQHIILIREVREGISKKNRHVYFNYFLPKVLGRYDIGFLSFDIQLFYLEELFNCLFLQSFYILKYTK